MKWVAWLSFLSLFGCSQPDSFVLLSGKSLDVTVADRTVSLDASQQGVTVGPGGLVRKKRFETEEIIKQFGQTLTILPEPTITYVLYFERGTDVLTEESKLTLVTIQADLQHRQSAELLIEGHTDTLGSEESNDVLSLDRAQIVLQLIKKSLSFSQAEYMVRLVGRGERSLLIATQDETKEIRNRRVEVHIR